MTSLLSRLFFVTYNYGDYLDISTRCNKWFGRHRGLPLVGFRRRTTNMPSPSLHGQKADDVLTRPLRIRVCMHVIERARIDVRVMREATTLQEEGYDVTIVDVESELQRPHEEDLHFVHLRHIMKPSWFVASQFKPWFLVKAAQMFLLGIWRLMQVPADIYHAHDITALPACYVVSKLRHKPLIFDAHELPLSERNITRWSKLHALGNMVFACILPYCRGVITVSPPIAQKLQHSYHIPEVTLVRNLPVYREIWKNDRLHQRLGLASEVKIALYQGNLNPDRGLDKLVQAAALLEPDIVIVLLGNGPDAVCSLLTALVTRTGVADRVKMLPAVPYEELLDWTASADVGLILLPPDYSFSIRMCLPNKLFEYLLAGLPVVSSQLDVVADILVTYDVGRVVPDITPEGIAHAINMLLADSVALARMHTNALAVSQNEFHWEKEAQHLLSLYRQVLLEKKTYEISAAYK